MLLICTELTRLMMCSECGDLLVFRKPYYLKKVYQFCEGMTEVLLEEQNYLRKLPKTSYLTAFQITMSDFFVFIKKIGMSQKDQITLVQNIFDGFNVDWDEGDRENIRVSLQQPALIHNDYVGSEIESILIEERLKKINAEHAQLISRMQELENKLAENKGQPTPEQFKAIMNLSETLPAEMKNSVNDRTIKFVIDTPDGKAKFNEILQLLRMCVAI